jgi:hypothetical protein
MKYTVKWHMKQGKKSGYPVCCRIWFLIRAKALMLLMPLPLGIANRLSNVLFYLAPFRVQHIICPLHLSLHIIFMSKPEYKKCECGEVFLVKKSNKHDLIFKKECGYGENHKQNRGIST